ncbi:guanine deaminase [Aphanomyces invadans]|uniref:Guanine deaminase n=1 Tax=Aphanomyces invadans TaxID=157072 RepID=A0A024TXJ0_9STRA|nr:guanine deaminase [Aphanomyces invadans]ETV98865.1 guanine deaminase [Aphanomyces invadans]|eukprot:XP_008872293.1 guanine deaminase [Aphanomyces invadans]
MPITAYKGVVVHSLALGRLEMLNPGLIGVNEHGTIEFVVDLATQSLDTVVFDKLIDYKENLLVPGFIDGHAHAPQYSFLGVGMHLPLLNWYVHDSWTHVSSQGCRLHTYTFPHESKFSDPTYAKHMYTKAVSRHVLNGTTTCSYFATIHLEACKVLADIVHDIGQRGYLGKVNMDRNATPELTETTHGSLADTKSFIEYVATKKNSLLTPVITPRFVPSTTSALMTGLAALADTYTLPIQSHLSENSKEIEWVRDLHPDCSSYAEVYDRHGLLNERAYMAHCIWCTPDERSLLKSRGASMIHCPNSNFSLTSGVLNVRQLLDEGVKVGLGTDVAAGYSTSMLDAIRHAVIASKVTSLTSPSHAPLSYAEVFHLATVGSADCLGLSDVVGNFVKGKELDMLVVDLNSANSPIDSHAHDDVSSQFQKFLFLGDDRNITDVYVRGRRVNLTAHDAAQAADSSKSIRCARTTDATSTDR